MKINEIRLDPRSQTTDAPVVFRINEPVVEDGYVVEEIKFFNSLLKPFNKACEISGDVYVIYFKGIKERRIIRAETVTSVEAIADKFTNIENTQLPE